MIISNIYIIYSLHIYYFYCILNVYQRYSTLVQAELEEFLKKSLTIIILIKYEKKHKI